MDIVEEKKILRKVVINLAAIVPCMQLLFNLICFHVIVCKEMV